MINNSIIYKFFKDFTNHRKKSNRAVAFSCRLFPNILKYRDHRWHLPKIWKTRFLQTLKYPTNKYELLTNTVQFPLERTPFSKIKQRTFTDFYVVNINPYMQTHQHWVGNTYILDNFPAKKCCLMSPPIALSHPL